ncbi:hypothetical protein [Streptomyces sp. NPDC054863]
MHDQAKPFPLPAAPEVQNAWVDAVLATAGVSTPRAALESIAPFIVEPEEMLTEANADGVRQLREKFLRTVRTDSGEMLVGVVKMHGVGGIVWEHNERISSQWSSAANPTRVNRGGEDLPLLQPVRPYSCTDGSGNEKPCAALESRVKDRETLIANARWASKVLEQKVGMRPYDLTEDLVLNGQQEPGMYVPQLISLETTSAVTVEGDGPVFPESYWGWMAVRGNNRAKSRHDIFGITSAEVLAGVPGTRFGEDSAEVECDPRVWLSKLSLFLNRDHAEKGESDTESVAFRASRIASVEAHVVLGASDPRRLYRIAQSSNRRDHVHPPLDFTPNDRARALGRSILGMYVAYGLMEEEIAEVLTGSAPIGRLPGMTEKSSPVELRDRRSMLLLREFFPVDAKKRQVIRRALSESPPSQLSSVEVNRRARAWSAMTSESFPRAWNPRIAEIFQAAEVRNGIALSECSVAELLEAADRDDEAFEELISYRAAHWLASYAIIDADRGSLAGQKTIADDGSEDVRVRRTVKNNLQAMRNNKVMAIGVLRELASAMNDGDLVPRKVDANGESLSDPLTRAWFNRAFPKESGTRPKKRSVVPKVPAAVEEAPPAVPPGPPVQEAEPPFRYGALAPLETEREGQVPGEGGFLPQGTPVVGTASFPGQRTDHAAQPPTGDQLVMRIQSLIDECGEITDLVKRLDSDADSGADAPGGTSVFSRQRADDAVIAITQSIRRLRALRDAVEDLAGSA